jgi:hypothetical protein
MKTSTLRSFANSNTLKRTFLEGCQRSGLFDLLADTGAAA